MHKVIEDPMGFMRRTEVWCIPNPMDPDPKEAIVVESSEPGIVRAYPADAAFISKIVLCQGPKGEKMMFLTTTQLLDPLHLMEVLRVMDFGRVKFNFGHAKAEFAAPAIQKFAYIITVSRDGADTGAEVLQSSSLVATNGDMMVIRRPDHDQVEPDWVYNWSFVQTKSGSHIVALTAGGRLVEFLRGNSRRFKDITPNGIEFVNDAVTIPHANDPSPMFAIAHKGGITWRGKPVLGTGNYDIANLAYDLEKHTLWARSRDNRVFRISLEGGGTEPVEKWSDMPTLFQEAISHKLIAGPAQWNPIITAWENPKEIITKNPETDAEVGTGKFTVKYRRMEVFPLFPNRKV